MAKTYKRNGFGRMRWVFYQQVWFWQVISVVMACLGLLIELARLALSRLGLDFGIVLNPVAWSLIGFGSFALVCLSLVRFIRFWKGLGTISRLADYRAERKAIKAIERGLLSAGLVRKTATETMVDVPTCDIREADHRTILRVEKLPSVSDIEKVAEAVNSSLRVGKFADYAVSEPVQTADGLYYVFELTDVNRDLTFKPSSIDDLVPERPYTIRLMNGVDWHYSTQSHAIISGLTGAFKTTTGLALAYQCVASGGDCFIINSKKEMTGLRSILGEDHVAETPEEALDMLGRLVEKMNERNEKIGREIATRGVMGLSGADLKARPVFIFCEELGALTEAYTDPKERKLFHGYLKSIAMIGRACLYELVVLLQVATVESVPAGIKSNTNLKILLGKSTSEMVTQVFSSGYADHVTNNPGRFRGWYFLNGESTSPQLFYVPDLHTNGLNTFETFERLYKIGRQRVYNEAI